MKKLVKRLKPVQSYKTDGVYRLAPSFADKLVRIRKAEYVKKEEKKVLTTKEEKNHPLTKMPEASQEIIPISKLRGLVSDYSQSQLESLLKDERISAVRLAQEELQRRGEG